MTTQTRGGSTHFNIGAAINVSCRTGGWGARAWRHATLGKRARRRVSGVFLAEKARCGYRGRGSPYQKLSTFLHFDMPLDLID